MRATTKSRATQQRKEMPVPISRATIKRLDDFQPMHERCAEWLQRWKAARAGNLVPYWSAFDPLDLFESVTQSVFMKRQSTDNWTVMLIGSDMVDRIGEDFTGVNAIEIMTPDQREDSIAFLDYLHRTPGILHSINQISSQTDEPVVLEWLFLPFASEDGAVDRCVQVMAPVDDMVIPREPILAGSFVERRVFEETLVDLTLD